MVSGRTISVDDVGLTTTCVTDVSSVGGVVTVEAVLSVSVSIMEILHARKKKCK